MCLLPNVLRHRRYGVPNLSDAQNPARYYTLSPHVALNFRNVWRLSSVYRA